MCVCVCVFHHLKRVKGVFEAHYLVIHFGKVCLQFFLQAVVPLTQLRQLHQGSVEPLAELAHQALELRRKKKPQLFGWHVVGFSSYRLLHAYLNKSCLRANIWICPCDSSCLSSSQASDRLNRASFLFAFHAFSLMILTLPASLLKQHLCDSS